MNALAIVNAWRRTVMEQLLSHLHGHRAKALADLSRAASQGQLLGEPGMDKVKHLAEPSRCAAVAHLAVAAGRAGRASRATSWWLGRMGGFPTFLPPVVATGL
jgi:hypothetical protein